MALSAILIATALLQPHGIPRIRDVYTIQIPRHVIEKKQYGLTLQRNGETITDRVTFEVKPEADLSLKKGVAFRAPGEHLIRALVGTEVVHETKVIAYSDHADIALFRVTSPITEQAREKDNLLGVGRKAAFKIRKIGDVKTKVTDAFPPQFVLQVPPGVHVFDDENATSPMELVDGRATFTYGQLFFLNATAAGSELDIRVTSQAVLPGETRALVKSYGFKAVAVPDTVEIDKPSVELRNGMNTQVVATGKYKGQGAEGVKYTWDLNPKDAAEIAKGTEQTATVSLTAKKVGRATLTVTVRSETGETLTGTSQIDVLPALSKAMFEGETTIQKGDRVGFNLRLINEVGVSESLVGKKVEVKVAAESDPDKVKIRRRTETADPLAFTAEGLAVGESEVRFDITIDGETSKPLSIAAVFKVVEVTDFVPLEVSLQHLDEKTVANTFGPAISRDYHVLMVNMVNKLRALDNGTQVDGILVYGQSFEVGVDLLKPSGKSWVAVTFEDVTRAFSRAHANEENPVPVGVISQPVGSIVIEKRPGQLEASPNSYIHLRLNESAKLRVAHLENATVEATSENPGIVRVEGKDTVVANSVGEASISVTVTIQVKDEEKSRAASGKNEEKIVTRPAKATIKALVRVLPTSGTMLKLEPPSKIGLVEQVKRVSVATRADYVLGLDYPASDYTFTMDRSISFNPETGVVRALAPVETLITAIKKLDPDKGQVRYLGVNFVAADQAQLLPPSVFEDASGLRHVKAMLRYRPVAQELILLSQDQREATSKEGIFRNALGFAVQIFGWAYARKPEWAGNNDLVPGIIALGPEFVSRFVPDRSQINRNAILTQGMRATETIPFGGQLQRVVFFPKQSLNGYLPQQVVRIGSIDSSRFRISVGAITTLKPATEKNTIPPGTGATGTGGGR